MNRNRIVIGDLNNPIFVFENDQLRQVDVVLRSSYSGDELAYDQLNASTFAGEAWDLASNEGDDLYSSEDFQLVSSPADITGDIPAGTPVRYYVNDNLVGKFYAQPATRENRLVYDITAISAIGLLSKQAHKGGLYNGETFAEVATDIIGGAFTFSCSPDVGSIPIVGWIPFSKDARENLHQLLFAYGVMVFKDEAGDVYFDFANTNFRKTIGADKTYRNGSITPVEPAAMVRITEHQFFATADDLEYTLFDNNGGTTADNQLVLFDHAPIYALTASGGLTINENGVNYAIVSGNGTLTGKSYTHTQEVYERGTPGGSTIEITSQTFINQLNSISVARRLLNYYGVTETLTTDIQVEDEKPGQLVDITNQYNERVWAYISEMTITGLATAKARCNMLANFTPTKGGNNYNNKEVISANGTWTVPAGVTEILAVLIGGGHGGEGAQGGENGQAATFDHAGAGGKAGDPGQGGRPGKVFVKRISVTPGQVLTAVIGTGGAPGTAVAYGADKNAGSPGTATTFAGETSENGDMPENGFVDIVSGDVYANKGLDGTKAGDGGTTVTQSGPPTQYIVKDGGSVTYGGVTYPGGRSNLQYPDGASIAWQTDDAGHWWTYGGGSGAVAGHAGVNGTNGRIQSRTIIGGTGASAPAPDSPDPVDVTNYGTGGPGGNSGAGGGGAGGADNYDADVWYTADRDNYGTGSNGTDGREGAPGAVFIYY